MIEHSVEVQAETRAARMIRSFMEGAETGMIEIRGYGLTESERIEAGRVAARLYGETLIAEAASA